MQQYKSSLVLLTSKLKWHASEVPGQRSVSTQVLKRERTKPHSFLVFPVLVIYWLLFSIIKDIEGRLGDLCKVIQNHRALHKTLRDDLLVNDFWEVKKRWLLLTSLTSLFGVILCSFDFIRKKVYQLLETFQPQLLMVSGFLSSWSGKVEPSGLNKGPASGLHIERGSLEWSRGRLPWVDSW